MPLQNFYLDTDSLRVGNNQLYLQSNAVYVGNNLWVGNTIVLGNNFYTGFGGSVVDQPYGAQNKIVLSANSPSPIPFGGAIDMRIPTAGGRVGITFDSQTNLGSDFAYIYYYDDLPAYSISGTQERGTLLLGISNDLAGVSEDQVAIESPGNIFINPGMGTDAKVGSSSWNGTYGNLYVGNAAQRYLVLHEGVTGVTTLRTNVLFQSGNIQMSNTTSSNWIGWNTTGVNAPATTTRSTGTKLVLYPSVSSTAVDYAIGIESQAMWLSVPNPGASFKWYANTTTMMTLNTTAGLVVNAAFSAITKSFLIPHPTKPGMTLRHGSLEGPENGVYVRGRLTGADTITLPDYWDALVDANSVTVNLTPVGTHQKLFVKEANSTVVVIGTGEFFSKNVDCFYTVFAERKDVPNLVVEE